MAKYPIPVHFYRAANGAEPVREWLQGLSKIDKKSIGLDIKTVQYGWPLGMPLVRKLEKDLWEIRVRLKSGIVRVVFTMSSESIVLLHAFTKKSPKIPKNELTIAKDRLKQFKTGDHDEE